MYEVETLPEAHASGMKGKNIYEWYAQKCTELEITSSSLYKCCQVATSYEKFLEASPRINPGT